MGDGDLGHVSLRAAHDQLLSMAANSAMLAGVRANGLPSEPQYHIQVDTEKASALGVNIASIYVTMSVGRGTACVNDLSTGAG